MFPFIGIMADQEPKRAFTPSGSYSMGLFESGDSVDVTADITGTSDFTFMIWAYPTTANQYIFKTSDNTAYLQVKSDGKLRFQILNTNLTNSVVESASAISLNTMQMITVTGNTTNGLKLYINDVLNNSSSMPANNNVAGKTWQLGTNYDGSLALFRSWSKELSLADVKAHYAYDENLLLQGGVAVSAMTTDQKTSLEFAIEMIQDVPYDSDEFDDRSTNKYAVTNNGVTLFGQNLQVYTDASDLPSSEPNAFNVSTATLDGSTQYFDAGNPSELQITGNMTVSIWAKPSATSNEEIIISKYSYSNDQRAWLLRTRLGKYEFYIDDNGLGGGNNAVSTTSVSNTEYQHLIGEYNGSSYKIFVNGVEEDSEAHSLGIFNTSANMRVGAYDNSTGSGLFEFSGKLFQPRIWARVLTAQEKSAISQNPTKCWDDLIAEFPTLADGVYAPPLGNWNGNNGQELIDQSGSGITTTAIGSPTYEDTGALIVSDGGVQYNSAFATLDGSTQYFDAGNPTELQLSNNLTFSAWIYVTSDSTTPIISKWLGTGSQRAYQFTYQTGGNILCSTSSSGAGTTLSEVTTGAPISLNTWHHVSASKTNADIRIVVDGVEETSSTTGSDSAILNSTSDLHVGAFGDGATNFNGAIASPQVYNTGLSLSQQQDLCNDGIVPAYADIATSITDDCVYAPRLSNWDTNAGSELVDQSTSGITTTATGSPTYESELAVECNEAPV